MKYEDDGFDPTPYDRILGGIHTPARAPEHWEEQAEWEASARAAKEKSERVTAERETSGQDDKLDDKTWGSTAGNRREEESKGRRLMPKAGEARDGELAENQGADSEVENQGVDKETEGLGDDKELQQKEEALKRAARESIERAAVERGKRAVAVSEAEALTETIALDPREVGGDKQALHEMQANDPEAEQLTQGIAAVQEIGEQEPAKYEQETQKHAAENIQTSHQNTYLQNENKYVVKGRELIGTKNQNSAAPIKKREIGKLIPVGSAQLSGSIKYTDIREKQPTKIYIEEDILVPDVKGDLASVLNVDGTVHLSEKNQQIGQKGSDSIRVTGDIYLSTLYRPEDPSNEAISAINSKVPFKEDWTVDAAPLSNVEIRATIENIDHTVINERKYRVKVTLRLEMTEYAEVENTYFEGIKDEKIQTLRKRVTVTDVAFKKCDTMEIYQGINLKENTPMPTKVLNFYTNIIETNKQISGDKALISGIINYYILYEGQVQPIDENDDIVYEVALLQGKSDFTHYMQIPSGQTYSGSKVTFDGSDLKATVNTAAEAEKGSDVFVMDGDLGICLELYKNGDQDVVTDVYHNEKELVYDEVPVQYKSVAGHGATENSVREIINIPDKYGEVGKGIYASGYIKGIESTVEHGRNIVTGKIAASLLCLGADKEKTPFAVKQEIPFRCSMEIPGAKADMPVQNDVKIKEIWFEKINGRQMEINASVVASGLVYKTESCNLIKNVCFVEGDDSKQNQPSIVVYVSKADDSLWKVAKKFRTSLDTLRQVNGFEYDQPLKENTKLLIIR